MTKRFAFVIEDLYAGGAQKSLLYTAEGLRERGNEVIVFILRDLIEQPIPENLRIVNLNVVSQFTRAFPWSFVEKWQAHKIKAAVQAFSPDVFISCSCDRITRHIHWPSLYFWIKSDITSKFEDPKKRARAFRRALETYNGRRVIAVSEGVKTNLLEVLKLKPTWIEAIYNPYERTPFVMMAEEEVELPAQRYFISVGAIERRKRYDRLLDAYRLSGLKIPLVILGKGKEGEEEKLRALISEMNLDDQVRLLGFRMNPYPYISHATALVLTSDAEGLPRVLIESLMLHTPVISVNCPSGPREILAGSLAEYLVGLNDVSGLAEAMRKVVSDPPEINEEHYKKFLKESVLPQFEVL